MLTREKSCKKSSSGPIGTCQTASVGTVVYPPATTWSAVLTNMRAGSNMVTAIANVAAGTAHNDKTAYQWRERVA